MQKNLYVGVQCYPWFSVRGNNQKAQENCLYRLIANKSSRYCMALRLMKILKQKGTEKCQNVFVKPKRVGLSPTSVAREPTDEGLSLKRLGFTKPFSHFFTFLF